MEFNQEIATNFIEDLNFIVLACAPITQKDHDYYLRSQYTGPTSYDLRSWTKNEIEFVFDGFIECRLKIENGEYVFFCDTEEALRGGNDLRFMTLQIGRRACSLETLEP